MAAFGKKKKKKEKEEIKEMGLLKNNGKFKNLDGKKDIIDDGKGITIVSASSLENDQKFSGTNIEGASKIGTLIADRAIKKGVKSVVFDRGGYKYHGRVKALAEAARSAGLKF